jgi:hypothetical protein
MVVKMVVRPIAKLREETCSLSLGNPVSPRAIKLRKARGSDARPRRRAGQLIARTWCWTNRPYPRHGYQALDGRNR